MGFQPACRYCTCVGSLGILPRLLTAKHVINLLLFQREVGHHRRTNATDVLARRTVVSMSELFLLACGKKTNKQKRDKIKHDIKYNIDRQEDGEVPNYATVAYIHKL